jgi:hypothetical protein
MTNDEQREAIARIIDPSSWRVLDAYLAQVKRRPNAGYDPDNFKDIRSLVLADAILALQPGGWRNRATRAEAHAERLASLMGEMFEDGPVTVGFAGNPTAIVDLERRARAALSAYNQRTET